MGAYRVVHHGPYLQRGRGIGAIFATLFRALMPVAKAGVKTALKHGVKAAKSQVGRQALRVAKREIKKSGAKAVGRALAGENIIKGAGADLKLAQQRVGQAIIAGPKKKRTKRGGVVKRKLVTKKTHKKAPPSKKRRARVNTGW